MGAPTVNVEELDAWTRKTAEAIRNAGLLTFRFGAPAEERERDMRELRVALVSEALPLFVSLGAWRASFCEAHDPTPPPDVPTMCLRCLGEQEGRAEAEHARSLVLAFADTARAFISYYRKAGGCSNCGGYPHASSCYVGRFEAVIAQAEGRQ